MVKKFIDTESGRTIERSVMNAITIDCVIFGFDKGSLEVLLIEHAEGISKGKWGLPGGWIKEKESIDKAAHRLLAELTGLDNIYLEQLKAFGEPERFPLGRVITIGYYALVDINKVIPQKTDLDASIQWYDIKELPAMIMDHNTIVAKALDTLRLNLDEKLIAFNLLPETFTMKEVQQLYETIFDKPFARNNFQKMILDLNVLERLEKKFTGAANKAPFLYRFRR